jgi:L-2,4-diaminobutyrate decarboxylase
VKERELNDPDYLPDLKRHNDLNRRIFQRVAAEALAGRGVAIGFTDQYRISVGGEPICALKSYVLSPFADEEQMHAVVGHVLEACRAVEETSAS